MSGGASSRRDDSFVVGDLTDATTVAVGRDIRSIDNIGPIHGGEIGGATINAPILETATAKSISAEQAFERIGAAVRLNLEQIKSNMEQARRESSQFFKLTLVFTSLGFLIILFGVVLLLVGQVTAGVVTTASSIIPEVTALLFFSKDRELRKRVGAYNKYMLASQEVLTSIDLAETIDDVVKRNDMKQTIIKKVLKV